MQMHIVCYSSFIANTGAASILSGDTIPKTCTSSAAADQFVSGGRCASRLG